MHGLHGGLVVYSLWLGLMMFSGLVLGEKNQQLENLSSLKWQHRIVVFNEPENQADALRVIKAQKNNIETRDIVWFMFSGDAVESNYVGEMAGGFADHIRDQYQLSAGQVILIGKDGGLKSSFDGINLNAIFAAIDVMPMRRQERQD
jgi:hypothetical protein